MKYRLENTHFIRCRRRRGEVIGFANFSPVRLQNEAELGAIYLLPEQQGKGIGKCFITKRVNSIKRNSETIQSCRSSE